MNESATATVMTTEELFALPDDGIDRQLIRGELREKPMTKRNRWHSCVLINIGYILKSWLLTRPEPRGQIMGGEVGVRLRRNPDTTVGMDVAYISAAVLAGTPADMPWVDGPPVLAVEILSPSDKQEGIVETVREYLEAGVALVWIVDPDFETVRVHRPDAAPEMFNIHQELSGEPHLPGYRVAVAEIFRP